MIFRKLSLPVLCCLALFSFFLAACGDDDSNKPSSKLVADYEAEAALEWNKLFLEVERYAAGYRPGPAPRALAHLGLAAYEASISGMPDYQSLANRYPGLDIPQVTPNQEYHWPTVVHAVYATMMPQFFTNPPADVLAKWNDLESDLNAAYLLEAGQAVFDRSQAHGEAVGEAVWQWSISDPYGHDAYHDPFGNYDWAAHHDGPGSGDWEPTVPGPGKPMFPYWGKARTFAITEAQKLCQPPTPSFSEDTNSGFYTQALEVYNAIDDANWADGQWIAEFWSDDLVNLTFSPGPRWAAIGNQVIEAEGSSLETAIFCYAKLGMALNDASVACWHSKYVYNLERPESYIQRLIDPTWEPTLFNPMTNEAGITPSFPAYPSGHSTMGGAGAEVLTDVFGNHYDMMDNYHLGRTEFTGTPRFFNNFYQMAEENAMSRVPLGVHFRMDCEVGVDLGYACGRSVNKLPWKK